MDTPNPRLRVGGLLHHVLSHACSWKEHGGQRTGINRGILNRPRYFREATPLSTCLGDYLLILVYILRTLVLHSRTR
jgi:hypothetical protein